MTSIAITPIKSKWKIYIKNNFFANGGNIKNTTLSLLNIVKVVIIKFSVIILEIIQLIILMVFILFKLRIELNLFILI